MESLQFKGQITTTSNKQSKEFKAENPSKTAYVSVTNEDDRKKLQGFGLTLYSSENKETKQDDEFFIIKLSQNVKLYNSKEKEVKPAELSCSINEPNFKTKSEYVMNLIKGEKNKNEFVRINAILATDSDAIELLEAENPFANMD